ncbi:hypothetical protein FOZ60_015865 [Perkinsus olseni]|uniref:Uncharacterized protein n=1 Tax=Perkinsus olseni TaxID=32597 RepID=A0A7J6N5G7_PEROL|nr:hypothetical protein FOZ60_015865 [Perkinsus olseni]
MLLYDLCREQCGLLLASRTTMEAGAPAVGGARAAQSGPQQVEPKRLKMSLFVDSVDDGSFALLAIEDYSSRLKFFKQLYGDVPVPQIPTREELSALQSRLLEDESPFVNFRVWTPGQRKRLREEKTKRWTLDDGVPTKVISASTPSLAQRRESFVIFKHAMVMLEQSSFADFERYKSAVEGLTETFGDYWSVVVEANEVMRSSHIGSYKDANPQLPWGECFVLAADDAGFWRCHVDHKVMRLHFTDTEDPQKSGKGRGPRQRASKDVSQQFCYAYQDGRHTGDKCKDGRIHLCQGCNGRRDLPRGRNLCPKAAAAKASAASKGELAGSKPEGASPENRARRA